MSSVALRGSLVPRDVHFCVLAALLESHVNGTGMNLPTFMMMRHIGADFSDFG